ncbi:MAG TPA: tetratricopeptide repeat protein, partial [Chthoniobacterales bacterium]
PEPLMRRGFVLTQIKEYDKASADYSKVIKLKPDDIQAYLGRSNVYERKKDFAEGIADCDKALKLDPNNAEAKSRKERLEYYQKYPKAQASPSSGGVASPQPAPAALASASPSP